MNSTIYHKSRCSKSRTVMALLEAAGVELEVSEYLQTPPSAAGTSRPPESVLELYQ